MDEKAKITLSAKELELVCNTEWILTKHSVIKKVYRLFGELSENMQQLLEKEYLFLPGSIKDTGPKISKGENYQSLPYVMLDYPRCFGREDMLAIRIFFWWGNFFSINLQVSGKYQPGLIKTLEDNFSWLQANQYWVCVNDDPWQHHFELNNYLLIEKLTAERFVEIIESNDFIKIGKKIPVGQWENVLPFMEKTFEVLMMFLKINFPTGETGPSPGIPITGFDL